MEGLGHPQEQPPAVPRVRPRLRNCPPLGKLACDPLLHRPADGSHRLLEAVATPYAARKLIDLGGPTAPFGVDHNRDVVGEIQVALGGAGTSRARRCVRALLGESGRRLATPARRAFRLSGERGTSLGALSGVPLRSYGLGLGQRGGSAAAL